MRVLPRNVYHVGGRVRLGDADLTAMDDERFRREVQWSRMAMVMQASMNALNPVVRVGDQVAEPLRVLRGWSRARARARVAEVLQLVGVSPDFMSRYPFELSGGMRQRVVIALALAAEPELIIADEPTTALDVSVQAQILALLKRVCAERGAAVMLVTHDMGVIAETADRVAVMYAGRLIEIGPVNEVIRHPQHPYTVGLMASIPGLAKRRERLYQIEGAMPRLAAIPTGCAFNPRCPHAAERCRTERPELLSAGGSRAACWLHDPENPLPRRDALDARQGEPALDSPGETAR